ncbi:hypothetical protein [Paracoccus sulfuroxidans]|uniref:Phage-related protein n=1 Tax=Paracoccus sulfuroxidans TaxID=384678 RepID=A0A562NQ41_9RHOB|nr:hypothetical protein [Paracoccus sulfuroxidans]AZV00345.1 tail length tape measure protein [Paracoccus phage vB_PsuS_Psul1]TWI34302.1 phage-related protein [Paracoccus sulfuroxidans]
MATAAQLGKLKVDLVLDRAAFQRGIDQARSGIQKFTDTVNKRLSSIGNVPGLHGLQEVLSSVGKGVGAAVATGAAVAGAGLAGLSVSAINTAAEIKNLSILANATPAEFQAWASGAKTVGIEQEKLADILKDMNDRVGDFIATGGGPMADFFERIAPKVGVTAEQFRKLSGPQSLQLYVDSLERANVNQQDFTFFMEAIAGDSTALLPLLKNGGKAMQEYAARTAALGGIMSNESVKALAGMKTSLTEVGIVMRGLRNEMGAAFAPVIQSVAQTFVSLMTKGSALRVVIDALGAVVRIVAQVFADVVTIVSGVASALWELTRSAATAIDKATGLSDAFRWIIENSPIGWIYSLITGFAKLIKAQGGLGGAIKALGQLATAVWSAMGESARAIPPALASAWHTIRADFYQLVADLKLKWFEFLVAIGNSLKDAGFDDAAMTFGNMAEAAGSSFDRSMADVADAQGQAAAAAGRAAGIVADAWAPVAAMWSDLTTVTEDATAALSGDGGTSGGGLAGAADQAGKSAGGAKEKMSELQKVLKSLRDEAAELKETFNMSALQAKIWKDLRAAGVAGSSQSGKEISALNTQIDAMKRMRDATERGRDALGSFFGSILEGADAARKAFANLLLQIAQVQFMKGALGLLGQSSWGSALFRGVGSLLGENANGTPNWQGGMTRINERGGEILNLPRGTQIIPHDISKRMADKAASDGKSSVRISVDPSPLFEVKVQEVADNSANKMGESLMQGFPGMIQQFNHNPRRR